MRKPTDEYKELHYNLPQMLYAAIFAQVSVLIFGRGTGKTTGPGAYFTLQNVMSMPRSNGVYVNVTYEKLLRILIPGIVQGLEMFGIFQDQHYWVRKVPPKGLDIPRAYRAPLSFDNYIQFYNGSGIYLASLDRGDAANGLSVDWLYADEARFLPKERIDQLLLCLRGNAEHFGHLSNHRSVLFTSDMPRNPAEKWLLHYRDKMDDEACDLLISVQYQLALLQQQYDAAKGDKRRRIALQMEKWLDQQNELRKDLVYFGTATTLDNIHALGLDVIKTFKRVLSDMEFSISVLNKEVASGEDAFYPLLDEAKHGYSLTNHAYVDSLPLDYRLGGVVEKDSRWDADIDPHAPLDISVDANAAINWVTTGQEVGGEYRVTNGQYVKHPLRIKDCAAKWLRYYRHHTHKTVYFFYDNTMVGSNAKDDISFADEWTRHLEEGGWTVVRQYIGQSPTHESRYQFWSMMFRGDERLPLFRYNMNNCEQLITSMQNARLRKGRTGYNKDKKLEKNPNFPQEDATHGSEAVDILLWGKYRSSISGSGSGGFSGLF